MPDATDSLIEVSDVSRAFVSAAETVWAVRDVSLTAHAGEFVCVFGASGSGKSTLLNLIAGIDSADEGHITVGTAEVRALSEDQRAQLRLKTVGVVFQDHNLIEEFTAAENVALPLEVLGVDRQAAHDQAVEQLRKVGIDQLANRFPAQMSGGQRQRVGIARALAGQRTILLADEPTGALDSKTSRDLFSLIRDLCDRGVLAIVCSHDVTCQEYADTVYEMVDGTLMARASTGAVS